MRNEKQSFPDETLTDGCMERSSELEGCLLQKRMSSPAQFCAHVPVHWIQSVLLSIREKKADTVMTSDMTVANCFAALVWTFYGSLFSPMCLSCLVARPHRPHVTRGSRPSACLS